MKKLRAIIVDDEQDGIEVLQLMLADTPTQVNVVDTCNSANQAIESIQKHRPDVVFLDIEMPGKDGFEVLKAFPEADFKVVIVTGYDQYAMKAIKFLAMDYLLKPFDEAELASAVRKVEEALEQQDNRLAQFAQFLEQDETQMEKIVIPSSKGFRTVELNDIACLESKSGNYCIFHLADESETMVAKPLYYFEELLPQPRFLRVHRSRMVNLDQVSSYDSKTGELTMASGRVVEVSVRRRSEFNATFRSYFHG